MVITHGRSWSISRAFSFMVIHGTRSDRQWNTFVRWNFSRLLVKNLLYLLKFMRGFVGVHQLFHKRAMTQPYWRTRSCLPIASTEQWWPFMENLLYAGPLENIPSWPFMASAGRWRASHEHSLAFRDRSWTISRTLMNAHERSRNSHIERTLPLQEIMLVNGNYHERSCGFHESDKRKQAHYFSFAERGVHQSSTNNLEKNPWLMTTHERWPSRDIQWTFTSVIYKQTRQRRKLIFIRGPVVVNLTKMSDGRWYNPIQPTRRCYPCTASLGVLDNVKKTKFNSFPVLILYVRGRDANRRTMVRGKRFEGCSWTLTEVHGTFDGRRWTLMLVHERFHKKTLKVNMVQEEGQHNYIFLRHPALWDEPFRVARHASTQPSLS